MIGTLRIYHPEMFKLNLEMKRKTLISILFAILVSSIVCGQDEDFKNIFHSRIISNPAFTGYCEHPTISFNSQFQWSAFQNHSVSYDMYLPKIKSGIGFFVNDARYELLNRHNIQLNYAYYLKFENEFEIVPAISLGGNIIDFYKDKFRPPSTLDDPVLDSLILHQNNFNINIGFMIHHKNFIAAISALQINRPELKFHGDIITSKSAIIYKSLIAYRYANLDNMHATIFNKIYYTYFDYYNIEFGLEFSTLNFAYHIAYDTDNEFILGIAFKWNSINLAYNFAILRSSMYNLYTHEIGLSFYLLKNFKNENFIDIISF